MASRSRWGVDLVRWMIELAAGNCLRYLSWPPGYGPRATLSRREFTPKIRGGNSSLLPDC